VLADKSRVDVCGRNIIHGTRQFLVLGVLQEVMILQIGALLGRNDTLHQFHCRVVLTTILVAFRPYHHFVQLLGVGLQLDIILRGNG